MSFLSNLRRSTTSFRSTSTSPAPPFSSKASLPPAYMTSLPTDPTSAHDFLDPIHQRNDSVSSGTQVESEPGNLVDVGSVVDSAASVHHHIYSQALVYYRVFTPDGAISSKRPVNEQNPYLGCIEAVHITPPQTVASIIRCMCKVEEVARFYFARLFVFDVNATVMDEREALELLTGVGPGSDPRHPLALVLGPESNVFTRPIVAKHRFYLWSADWLNYKNKEVLYTDCVVRSEKCKTIGGTYTFDAYRAQNVKGRIGFVLVQNFEQIS